MSCRKPVTCVAYCLGSYQYQPQETLALLKYYLGKILYNLGLLILEGDSMRLRGPGPVCPTIS